MNPIVESHFNNQLSPVNKSSIQEINRITSEIIDIIHTYKIFHPNTGEYKFYSAVHTRFSKRDCILGHKTNL